MEAPERLSRYKELVNAAEKLKQEGDYRFKMLLLDSGYDQSFPHWQVVYLARCHLTDEMFQNIVNSENFRKNVRWADFSYNKLTEASFEALCQAKPQVLRYVNLAGNQFEDPRETGGYDQGNLVPESISVSKFGSQLEKTYGYQAWLHPLTLFGETPSAEELVEYRPRK